MGIDSVKKGISRREFLWQGAVVAGAHLAVFSIPSVGGALLRNLRARGMSRWYEIVQDMKDEDKWHVNLFAAPVLGNLPRAKHLEHKVLFTEEMMSLKKQLPYPARFQYVDGRKEQTF